MDTTSSPGSNTPLSDDPNLTISIQHYPGLCYQTIMPPPPHNMLLQSNNNNNSTKSYNRNHYHGWNNNKKRTNRNGETQPTEHHHKNGKKSDNNKNAHDESKSKDTQNNAQFYHARSQENLPATFNHTTHPHNGYYYHKHRYFPHRQDRYHNNNNNRHKRSIPFNIESHYSLVDLLMDKFMARSKFVQVTEKPINLVINNEWSDLSLEIWDTFVSCQQTEETYKKKLILWQYLYTFIRKVFPRYGLFLVGSTMSGFGCEASDVDICLLVRTSYVDQRNEALNYLDQIKCALKDCDFVDRAELIWAKVPILKFHDSIRDLEVDLNCNNSVGIRNTHLLHCYANMDWRVRPLVVVVKLWARANNINDAKNMTISSYSLVLMVIHFLQCGVAPPVVPCLHGLYPGKFVSYTDIHLIDMQEQLMPFHSDNNQTLAELLLAFLHYYATFNYALYAISIRLGARIPIEECRMARSTKNDPHQWKFLCIEEPFDFSNTARSVYDPMVFERIKAVFMHSYNRLHESRALLSIFKYDDIEKLS